MDRVSSLDFRVSGTLFVTAGILAAFLTGCEDLGGSFLRSNPTLARLSELSEEEANELPVGRRYRWAFESFEIEAADLRRGIRWRNALKVKNASERVCSYLEIMRDLVDGEEARGAAEDARLNFAALGRALSGGRWYRSGMDAADDLVEGVRERLAPGKVGLRGDEPASADIQKVKAAEATVGKMWKVRAKREELEETGTASMVRYVLVLVSETGTLMETVVDRDAFEKARVGEAPPSGNADGETR